MNFVLSMVLSISPHILPLLIFVQLRSAPEVPWQLLQLTLLDPLATDFIYLETPHATGNDDDAAAAGGVAATSSFDDAGSVANSVDFV